MSGLGPLRRFVRRLNYRDEVLEHLDALLLSYPSGRQFTKDFPGLRAAIRAHWDAGVAPASSAVQLAARIVEAFVTQLDDAAKGEVLANLRTIDRGTLEALAAERIARRRTPPAEPAAFATQLCGLALFMAHRMTKNGTLRPEELDHLVSTVESALPDAAGNAADAAPRAGSLAALFVAPERPS